MQRIKKMLYSATAYTVLFVSFFYIFALAANLESTSISVGRFFLIFAFSIICSTAELIYELLSFKKWIRVLIHYAILLLAFCIIFISGDFFTLKGWASVFVATVLFTALYFVFAGTFYLIRKTVDKADTALDRRIEAREKAIKSKDKKQETYTPRFK